MILKLLNQTGSEKKYLSDTVTLPSSGDYTATASNIFPLARDAALVYDCLNGDVFLTDGSNSYKNTDAVEYLNQVALSIGGSVVGYAGANAPSFQITMGGKDAAGKSQPARMNAAGDIAINHRNSFLNITGNGTTTVKSGPGTLHGILINDNTCNGVVTIYDNTAGSGTKIATIQLGTPSGGLLSSSGKHPPTFLGPLGLEFNTGLTIVTSGSTSNDITAVYQ